MKRIIYVIMIALATSACKEDTLSVYHGDNYLHFTPGINDKAEVLYNFALDGETSTEKEVAIPVQIRLWGYLPTSDIRCNVSVTGQGTTANESDYVNPEYAIFREGFHVDTLWVSVRRRPELLSTDYKLVVDLLNADNGFVVAPAKYASVTIHIIDEIPNVPVWWETTQVLGEYTPIKYRLFNIYMNRVVEDIASYTVDGFKMEVARFKSWLRDNASVYAEALDVFNSIP